MFKSLFILILVTILCLYKGYGQNVKSDSLKSYFDGKLFMDTTAITWSLPGLNEMVGNDKTKSKKDLSTHKDTLYRDSSAAKWLSELLYKEKQPKLPLDSPDFLFRFTWLRSRNRKMFITLFEKNGVLISKTKFLRGTLYETIELAPNKLFEFIAVLQSAGFWKLKPAKASIFGNNRSTWLIEGQDGHNYHFVYREFEPRDLYKVGEWLIRNSAAKSEQIY